MTGSQVASPEPSFGVITISGRSDDTIVLKGSIIAEIPAPRGRRRRGPGRLHRLRFSDGTAIAAQYTHEEFWQITVLHLARNAIVNYLYRCPGDRADNATDILAISSTTGFGSTVNGRPVVTA